MSSLSCTRLTRTWSGRTGQTRITVERQTSTSQCSSESLKCLYMLVDKFLYRHVSNLLMHTHKHTHPHKHTHVQEHSLELSCVQTRHQLQSRYETGDFFNRVHLCSEKDPSLPPSLSLPGMTDLLAPLLAALDSEPDAFWCFTRLVEGSAFFKPAKHHISVDRQLVRM